MWVYGREVVPLEIAARKLRGYYGDDSDFRFRTQLMLYGSTNYARRGRLRPAEIQELLAANTTLHSVSSLCQNSLPFRRGVRAVITYNYDDFLEKSLSTYPYQTIWRAEKLKPRTLPIFHVHGYIPAKGNGGSRMDEVVLTEDQYNRASQDLYSWQNLVQINALSGSVGLMVGLSLTDRNLRRILDALKNLPQEVENYALLQRPRSWNVDDHDIDSILEIMKYRINNGFEAGYGEKEIARLEKPDVREKIFDAGRALEKQDLRRGETMLKELGVRTIRYEDHTEVKEIMDQINAAAPRAKSG